MNYTNNVPCHTIKPLERKWFRYLVRQIDYKYLSENYQIKLSRPLDDYIDHFISKYGIGKRMLYYYMDKWEKRKIFSIDGQEFNYILFVENINFNIYLDSSVRNYRNIVPYRVRRLFNRAKHKSFLRTRIN